MGGFTGGLRDLLGGFNQVRRIDKEGFDFREQQAQENLARQQQQRGWEQLNEDWATKATAEAALGTPDGEDISSLIPEQVNQARVKARVGGAIPQMKSSLKSQDLASRQLEIALRNQGALDVTTARGEQAQALARVRADIEANREPSPRDIELLQKRGEIQKDVAQTVAGMRPGPPPIPITTTDEKGNTIQTFITREQANAMATGNAGAAGGPMKGIPKPEGATVQARVRGAAASLQVGNRLLQELQDPEVQAQLGAAMGRYKTLEGAVGAGDPIAMKLYGELKSFSALQPGIHGMRSVKMMEDIEQALKLGQSPESLAAKIQGINQAAEALINPLSTLHSGAKSPGGHGPAVMQRRLPNGTIQKKDAQGNVWEE